MKEKYSRFFWPSFADLMTSLFFVMMALFILAIVLMNDYATQLKNTADTLKVQADKFKKIQEIDSALHLLDPELFEYDYRNKRYRLKIDVRFQSNSSDLNKISNVYRIKPLLIKAGKGIHNLIGGLESNDLDVNYLLVIEGNTQRADQNWIYAPTIGYNLSYNRALALFNFWKTNGIDFYKLDHCEVIIAGSGYFSKSRDLNNEYNNRRFTIQITPKVGRF